MRHATFALLTMVISAQAAAHPLFPQNMNEKEQQQFTAAVQQLNTCIAATDPAEIERLQGESRNAASKIRYLCFSGKRDEADDLRQRFYNQMMQSDVVSDVQACGAKIPPQYSSYLSTPLELSQFGGKSDEHICDHEIMPVDKVHKHDH